MSVSYGWQLCGDYDERYHPGRAIAEVKYDGLLVMVEDGRIWTRPRDKRPSKDVTYQFPEVKVPKELVLLGELCILQNGVSQFHRIQGRLVEGESAIRLRSRMLPSTFVAFDVLEVGGQKLADKPLEERRVTLNALPSAAKMENVFVPPYWDCPKEKVPELLEIIRASRAEGLVVKDLDGHYKPGRNHSWMKEKAWNEYTAEVKDMEITPNLGFVVYVDTPKGYRQKVVVNDTNLQGRIQRREVTHLVIRFLDAENGASEDTGALRQPHVAGVPYYEH